MTDVDLSSGFGRRTQSRIYRDGATGRRPKVPTRWDALVASAERATSARAWSYIEGSSGRESTRDENHAALDRWRIVPRVLRDVDERDLSVELFGRRLPSPLLAAPIGVLGLIHPDADVHIARAAGRLGMPAIISSQASVPMERIAREATDTPRWFQLYWSRSDELVESFVRRAEASGCEAIVVTLDTHVLGWRPRDLDAGFLPFAHGQGIAQYTSDPVFQLLVLNRMTAGDPLAKPPRITPQAIATLLRTTRSHPGRFWRNLRSKEPRFAVETFLEVFSRSSLTWRDLEFVRSRTKLPILLKGVQHPDDARLALEHGVDGIIVSNHAGRQVDGAVASIDALPGVVAAVAGRAPVLFDSGVRSGSDVAKALALGATAVCVGRPYAYGLAIDGEQGAVDVLSHLVAELDLTMALAGCRSIGELAPDTLVRSGDLPR